MQAYLKTLIVNTLFNQLWVKNIYIIENRSGDKVKNQDLKPCNQNMLSLFKCYYFNKLAMVICCILGTARSSYLKLKSAYIVRITQLFLLIG